MKAVALGLRITALLAALVPVAATAADLPKPTVTIENRGSACVAPPAEMRRNHMEMLKHQRDRTHRNGERGTKVSLNGCIECHASKTTGSVVGGKDDFCESCHAYVAVKLDCFECHQGKNGAARSLKVSEKRP